MEFRNSPALHLSSPSFPSFPPSYTKFNSALNAGLLQRTRSNPTLFDIMSNDVEYHPRNGNNNNNVQERTPELAGICTRDNKLFNDTETADVRLTLTCNDDLKATLNLHRGVLTEHSKFFAAKLKQCSSIIPCIVDVSDCDDVEAYVETIRLMYCSGELRRRLIKEDVNKVLSILNVSSTIVFDEGVMACLEYLEAAPWAEEEEEKVASVISHLQLDTISEADEVLKRVTIDTNSFAKTNESKYNGSEDVLVGLLQVVLQGKDDKAKREMKTLLSKMLRENKYATADISKKSFYDAVDSCLILLRNQFVQTVHGDATNTLQIVRQADNLHWLLDMLIDRQIADDFLRKWASEAELAAMHSKVQALHRHEVSRVTARLFVGIGKGQILVSKETRCLLLKNWLEPFYEDFGWMRRACKGLDRHVVEDGLANTVLTLPLAMQQEVMLAWFDRFLNCGDDCPNIQKGFEVWWRRAFWGRNGETEKSTSIQMRIPAVCENTL